jgi:hypothetical protein
MSSNPTRRERVSWPPIAERAAEIARSYATPVTLRQLFYRLVAELLIPNTLRYYKALSRQTARARRQDGFPSLIDQGRSIERPCPSTIPRMRSPTCATCTDATAPRGSPTRSISESRKRAWSSS